MAMSIVKPVSEGVGARRASTPSETEPTCFVFQDPDPEVVEHPVRRQFTAKYKLSVLQQADACKKQGDIAALLRREGIYSSNINTWRRQREQGILQALTPKQRGRKPSPFDLATQEVEQLRKENDRLAKRLKQAELIIDVQKKVSQILGITLATPLESEFV
jgi:transposase